MQPRRDRVPLRAETVFQVTKRGESVMGLGRPMPMGVKVSVEEAGVVSVVEGSREEVEDEEPGVEEPDWERSDRRASVGLRGRGGLEVMGELLEGAASSGGGSLRSSSAEDSSLSRPFG